MKLGTTITLSQREVSLLRAKLTANAEWSLSDVRIAGDILHKLKFARRERRSAASSKLVTAAARLRG